MGRSLCLFSAMVLACWGATALAAPETSKGVQAAETAEAVEVIDLRIPTRRLLALLPGGLLQYVKVDAGRNAAVVSCPEAVRIQVREAIKNLDRLPEQIDFDVRLIETGRASCRTSVSLQDREGTAFVSNGTAPPTRSRWSASVQFTTLSGEKATVDVQSDLNVPRTDGGTINGIGSQKKNPAVTMRTGTIIDVEPTVLADGSVLSYWKFEFSFLDPSAPGKSLPSTRRYRLINTLLLKNGVENVTCLPAASREADNMRVSITPRVR